jgi:hypothetical protein
MACVYKGFRLSAPSSFATVIEQHGWPVAKAYTLAQAPILVGGLLLRQGAGIRVKLSLEP